MRECKKCHVQILNDTSICPLCKSVLEVTGEDAEYTGYPDVKSASEKLSFLVRLYSFFAIVIEAALITINYLTYRGIWWSAVSGIVILYFFITLKYSLQRNNGYKNVILVQLTGAVMLTIATDHIVGYQGWSMNYVLPSAILLLNATIGILMIVNQSNWQSYLLMQILTVLLSCGCIVLWKFGVITSPILTFVTLSVSTLMLLGTLIFGDREAKAELKRRFHV